MLGVVDAMAFMSAVLTVTGVIRISLVRHGLHILCLLMRHVVFVMLMVRFVF